MQERVGRALLAFVLVAGLVPAAEAQVTTGQISGTVRDSTGGVIQRAEIVVINQGTGISRTVPSDDQGRYEAFNLAPGNYEVVVTANGFKTEIRSGITITVGLNAVLNFSLEPGAISEQITVISQAPLVETASSQVGALVNREQIRELPLNGRDYTQLALLQPGVVAYREQSVELNRGMGVRFSISGARHNQVGFRLNGIDIGDGAGTTPGSATGHNLGVDAIQEFQVLTNTFSAEQGKAAGGVVNIVHKSGTNELHGSAFEYLRNSRFDARNFFDPPGSKPPFTRNQFGFSLGGPVFRNKTFFFTAYEGLRERLSLTGINTVISEEAKSGALGPVSPLMKPYLDVMPRGNGRVFPNGTAEFITEIDTRADEDYIVGKIDHTFSESDSLAVSYTYDNGRVNAPSPRAGIVTYSVESKNRYQYLTTNHSHIFGPNLLHVLRAGFNSSHVRADRVPLIEVPGNLRFVPGVDFSSMEATGIDLFGIPFDTTSEREIPLDSFQIANSLTWVRGGHSFKAGMEAYHFRVSNSTPGRSGGGRYTFDSIPDLLAARPTVFNVDDPNADRRPQIRQNLFGFFIQDDMRVSSSVTINAGLRYEFITIPRSTRPNQSTLANLTDPQLTTSETFLGRNPSLKNFAPRLGFAWDVGGNQMTAVRGGIGVYHDQVTSYYYLPVIESNPPFGLTSRVDRAPFPNGYDLIATGRLPSRFSLQMLQYDMDQPWRLQYNVGLQRQLSRTMAVAAYYVGARAYNSTQFYLNVNSRVPTRREDGRLFFDSRSPVLNPNFGAVQYRATTGEGWYNSLQLILQRRPSAGLSFQTSYTLQKSVDTGSIASFSSEGLNTVVQQSHFTDDGEKGLSSFDVRHTFSTNVNYELPFGQDATGVRRALAAGWQLSAILNLSSGHPFTPILGFDNANVVTRSRGDHLRPDLVPGANPNPVDPGNVDRYFDPSSFALPPRGTLGNLPRNTLIGPGSAVVDFSARKRFAIGPRALEFRAEAFNVLNRPNFRIPEDTQRVVFQRTGPNPSAGRITATSTTSRQVQFSLRFEF